MASKQIPFFATATDLSALLREVCFLTPVEFAVMGLFEEEFPIVLGDPLLVQPLTSYLAYRKGRRTISRPVQQHGGGVKFAVDPGVNPWSVALRCGGQVGHERLTAGDLSVATDNAEAKEIFDLFRGVIRRRFQKIKSYYVGEEAIQLLNDGARLSPTGKSPPEYDLAK